MNGTSTKAPNSERDDRGLGGKIFWLLAVAAALHMIYYYPLLPDRVASHFDAYGRPNGWSGKTTFFSIYAGVVILMAIIQITTRLSFARMPVSLINLPNKDYWLSPERRAESMVVFMKYMSGFWSATLFFLMSTMHLAIRVNLGWRQSLGDWFFLLLAAYILFTLVWTVALIRRFAIKTGASKTVSGGS
jgi:uncharacterized membrane protein